MKKIRMCISSLAPRTPGSAVPPLEEKQLQVALFLSLQECFQQERHGAGSELHGQEVLLPQSRRADA